MVSIPDTRVTKTALISITSTYAQKQKLSLRSARSPTYRPISFFFHRCYSPGSRDFLLLSTARYCENNRLGNCIDYRTCGAANDRRASARARGVIIAGCFFSESEPSILRVTQLIGVTLRISSRDSQGGGR